MYLFENSRSWMYGTKLQNSMLRMHKYVTHTESVYFGTRRNNVWAWQVTDTGGCRNLYSWPRRVPTQTSISRPSGAGNTSMETCLTSKHNPIPNSRMPRISVGKTATMWTRIRNGHTARAGRPTWKYWRVSRDSDSMVLTHDSTKNRSGSLLTRAKTLPRAIGTCEIACLDLALITSKCDGK